LIDATGTASTRSVGTCSGKDRGRIGEGNDEVPVEGGGNSGEGVEAIAGTSAFLEA
jgi:hypothetical protein